MANHLRTLFCSVAVSLLFAAPGSAEIIRLTWNANTESNLGGYRLSYGTSPGVHPTTVDVGNQTSAQVTGLAAGQRYYFVLRAYATDGTQSGPSNEVSGVALSVVSLTSTANSSPIPTGAPVTWTALSSSGPSLEYQFSRQHQPTGTWTIVQPYGASNSFTWTPQVGEESTYVMRAWARVPGSTESFDARRETAPFAVGNAGIVIGAVEADVSLPGAVGSPITFKASAIGGPAPLQYRFYRYNYQTNVWTLGRDYSPSDSYTWTPTAADEGTYNVQVWVRRAGSTATYDAYRSSDAFSIKNGPPVIASVTANTPFPAGVGTPITWKVSASGGAGPLHYRFYRLSRATGVWTLGQDYGPSDSYTWTPTTADQGTYAIQAWVRRSGSTATYEAVLGTLDFQIGNGSPVIVSLTSNSGPPVAAGAPVTWTAEASGGPGPLQYAFSLYSVERDSWSLVKPYSSSKTFTWAPGPWDLGSYNLRVDVRRSGSTAASEAVASTGTISVTNNTVPTIVSVVRSAGLLRVGAPIVWTAKAAGGAPGLEYSFARYNTATQQWVVVQAYSWDTSYAWTPMAGDEGTYSLQVYVRRAGTTGAYEHTVATGNFTITN
jgi:hypothetical protein